jgi:hypothetical protein
LGIGIDHPDTLLEGFQQLAVLPFTLPQGFLCLLSLGNVQGILDAPVEIAAAIKERVCIEFYVLQLSIRGEVKVLCQGRFPGPLNCFGGTGVPGGRAGLYTPVGEGVASHRSREALRTSSRVCDLDRIVGGVDYIEWVREGFDDAPRKLVLLAYLLFGLSSENRLCNRARLAHAFSPPRV